MHAHKSFLSLSLSLVCAMTAQAQIKTVETTTASTSNVISEKTLAELPFQKKNWQFIATQEAGLSYVNESQQGQPSGYLDKAALNLGADYMVANNVGLGLDLRLNEQGNHYQADNSTSKWMAYADIMYGKSITPNIGLYGKFSFGLGSTSSTDKSGSNSTTTKNNLTGFRFELAAPIRFTGHEYITPFISYNLLTTSFDGGKQHDDGARIGFRFETYLGPNNFSCPSHQVPAFSSNLYQPGSSFIDFSSSGRIGFGSITTTNSGTGGTSGSEDYSCESVCVDYKYYIFHDLALGARLELGGNSQNDKQGDTKITMGKWMFAPGIEINAPSHGGLNNLFLDLGLGFGAQNNKTNSGSNSTSDKTNIFSFGASMGYNYLFARDIAFTPKIGYMSNSFTYSGSNNKGYSQGPKLDLGIRFFIP
jgi:hypothetical protein